MTLSDARQNTAHYYDNGSIEDRSFIHETTKSPGNYENGEETDLSARKIQMESLPVMATSQDVREIVRTLKNRDRGIPLVEILGYEPRRIFAPRKIIAYEQWGIVRRDDARLKLTRLGEKLAGIISAENSIFQEIIVSIPIYLLTVKWAEDQAFDLVTQYNVADFWKQSPDFHVNFKQKTENDFESEIASFFSVCHAAELGTAIAGKRGQPFRLRPNLERISEFLLNLNRPGNLPLAQDSPNITGTKTHVSVAKTDAPVNHEFQIKRVYLSVEDNCASKSEFIVESLSRILELADFEMVTSERPDEQDPLQSSKRKAMHSCQAGVISVGKQDCQKNSEGQIEVSAGKLTEIVVANALFNGRVIIIWNVDAFPPPEYLSGNSIHILSAESGNAFHISCETVKRLKELNAG